MNPPFRRIASTGIVAAVLLTSSAGVRAQEHRASTIYEHQYHGPTDAQILHDSQEHAKQKEAEKEQARQASLDRLEQQFQKDREREREKQLTRFAEEQRQREEREKEWLEKRQRTEAELRLHK